MFPPPAAPLDVARKLYARHRVGGNGLRTLLAWRGGWMHWETTHWSEMDPARLRSEIYDHWATWTTSTRREATTAWSTTRSGRGVPISTRSPTSSKRWPRSGTCRLTSTRHRGSAYIALRKPLQDKSSHVRTGYSTYRRALHDHTPALFNAVRCRSPTIRTLNRRLWLEFLASLWPDDPDSIALLQEYVGYVLSGRTDMQKMLLLIGPTRSGKGTVARMLTELIGRGHVAGPTLASLGTNFGLSPLLGKPLAIISDARLGDTPRTPSWNGCCRSLARTC